MTDHDYMLRALALAELGRGAVEPNPLVGAVVVQGDRIVGEGHHQRFGGPHAEIHALDQAGHASRGATLYVTLEPCCHFGKTPPCVDRLLAEGVRRVVVAEVDPFPQVRGDGIRQLREAGVVVDVGVAQDRARRQNAPFFKRMATGRPYIHAKWAMTLDGKIATVAGESKWISNETSRRHAHQFRGTVDAIVCGIGTALADDPLLSARPAGPRQATRVILDRRARLPLDGQLARTARDFPTLVVCSEDADANRQRSLRDLGCEVAALRTSPTETASEIETLLDEMGRRGWTNVLVEGGPRVLGSLLDADAIDAVHVYIAAKLTGGTTAPSPIAGQGIGRLVDALHLEIQRTELLDGDVHVRADRPIGS